MLPLDEIRRRIDAARGLAGFASWDELADATTYGRTTISALGTERGKTTERHLREVATACGVTFDWFTVPDLAAAVASAAGETGPPGIPEIQTQLSELRAHVRQLATDSLRHTRELQELRDTGRGTGSAGGDAR